MITKPKKKMEDKVVDIEITQGAGKGEVYRCFLIDNNGEQSVTPYNDGIRFSDGSIFKSVERVNILNDVSEIVTISA